MELCSNKHGEVCYDGSDCPVCTVRDDLQGTIDSLEHRAFLERVQIWPDILKEAWRLLGPEPKEPPKEK